VVLVIITNLKIDIPVDSDKWPLDLILISRDELEAFLGPLAHRGLLAANDE